MVKFSRERSQNVDMSSFRQNNSQLRLLKFIKLYNQNPLENFFFIFTFYQNYTLLSIVTSIWHLEKLNQYNFNETIFLT